MRPRSPRKIGFVPSAPVGTSGTGRIGCRNVSRTRSDRRRAESLQTSPGRKERAEARAFRIPLEYQGRFNRARGGTQEEATPTRRPCDRLVTRKGGHPSDADLRTLVLLRMGSDGDIRRSPMTATPHQAACRAGPARSPNEWCEPSRSDAVGEVWCRDNRDHIGDGTREGTGTGVEVRASPCCVMRRVLFRLRRAAA